MTERLYIVTGASRGLGAALAEQVLAPGVTLLGLSRGRHAGLAALAEAAEATVEQWPVDLAEPLPVAARLEAWLGRVDAQRFDAAVLVNNAALIPSAGPLESIAPDELARVLRVGLEAPLLLAGAFLRATRGWRAERRVLQVSSGLGRRPMAGQATYCAIKAGLDHAARAMALDGARVAAVAPGVIDTDMQAQLRASDSAQFPEHQLFVDMKRGGQLDTPTQAAAKLLALLRREDFGSQPVTDVRGL
ncbi:MAG TPA: SDR family NAD(P)-dependent oxidoreductase [Methylibium sp.]|nr:SDR family NAD(P)-dependent oxidoreductase [Methylibium sp.]